MTDIEQIKREVFHAVYDTQITQPSGIFEAIDYLHSRGYLGDIIKKTENVKVLSEHVDAVKVPDGYVLVPREPLITMIDAGELYASTSCEDIVSECRSRTVNIYKAMIAASPIGETK